MQPSLGRIVIYTKRIPEMIAFYTAYFGFQAKERAGDRIVELCQPDGGTTLLLHPAGKGQREGQSLVKLVFDTRDVTGFCRVSAEKGLIFGPIHKTGGYEFANAKDPSNNSVSVSSRAFADES